MTLVDKELRYYNCTECTKYEILIFAKVLYIVHLLQLSGLKNDMYFKKFIF